LQQRIRLQVYQLYPAFIEVGVETEQAQL